MNKMKIDRGDWLVVCDGRKGLIPKNFGDEMFPNLRARKVHEQSNLATSAQRADEPGRLHAAIGCNARTAVEQTDWRDEVYDIEKQLLLSGAAE